MNNSLFGFNGPNAGTYDLLILEEIIKEEEEEKKKEEAKRVSEKKEVYSNRGSTF